MKPFVARCIQYITLALMFIICMIGAFMPNVLIVCIGGAVGLVGAVIWVIFGRCNHCGEFFGRNLPEYCPHCGEKTDEFKQ